MSEQAPSPWPQITIDDFESVDIRVGRVLECAPFPEARNPAYKLTIDFGPLGVRRSSAQLTAFYSPEALVGRLILAVVNLAPRRIAGFTSEVLVLGVPGKVGGGQAGVVLLSTEREVEPGAQVF